MKGMTQQINWHMKNPSEIFDELHSASHGLTEEEAKRRLLENGLNKLPEGKVDGIPIIFFRQFQSSLIYILLVASIIIFFIGEVTDSFIILAVLFFNAIVGTFQEGKARNTLNALKKFTETNATILRAGKEMIIPDSEVVFGDIVILQEGEKVPADVRLVSASNLKIDEAVLTGESGSVHKISETEEKENVPLTERKNMAYKGTNVLSGNGRGVVVATGQETVIGKISKQIADINTELPLKANIRSLSSVIILATAVISAVLFLLGMWGGNSAREMFTVVVSLSVSIIPEGLPIVLTLVLATGVWRMSKRNVLIKRLQAVESLGQARIIAVDKTGTITKNEMVIRKVFVDTKMFDIGGVGYEQAGEVKLNGTVVDAVNHPELLLAGKIASFCASARVSFSEEEKIWRVTGDPTEAAMLVFGEKMGFDKDDLEKEVSPIGEIPFDYKLKYHTMLHEGGGEKFLTVVGAPEVVLGLCKNVWHGNKSHLFTVDEREDLEKMVKSLSEEGLRVLAFAETREPPVVLASENIKSLTFVGFFGMKDALRREVADAMKRTTEAGIKVVMITGDHKLTATAIAKEVGIYKDGDTILTGDEIDKLSDAELSEKLADTSLFVRVTPEHKLRIIQGYKARGETIAMTGDGVNDAPSLVAADLGVAMGKIGTEVAKEASDIILLDDNFGSIVSAVEEGRSIYKTIKKVILYLFSTNCGEALTITIALLIGFPLPILAAQIIWLNFVTDGFLDVALAMEPKEEGLLHGNFERPGKYIVDKLMAQRMVLMSVTMAVGTLILFSRYFVVDLPKAWTISLTTLAIFQWFNAWNCRHESKSLFTMNPFSNKYLIGATFLIIGLQMLAVYNPFMQKILHTVPLERAEWKMIIAVASSIIIVEEIRKFFYRSTK
jgi:Ca2+-transporting ATPase